MTPIKRIEIVVEAGYESTVEKIIKDCGIGGFTLLRNVAGAGGRGGRNNDGLTGVFENICFVVAAQPEAAPPLLEKLRPLLAEVGGICLVSDAEWLAH